MVCADAGRQFLYVDEIGQAFRYLRDHADLKEEMRQFILRGGLGRSRRSSQWNGSLNRSELEVQFLEAPEQKRPVPFEPTIACRTVLSL
jgi:hypothetical protein